ncbi:MAG: hypothetical protein ACE5JP_02030 [Candidatus Bipolaricaulia bacterium]
MLIHGERQFLQTPFDDENEIEQVVVDNADYIFGPGSIYLPKRVLRTLDDYGTVPDGFVVDIPNRQWFIVEAELSSHSVWGHIAQQVAKQIVAATRQTTKRLLAEMVVSAVREDDDLMEKFTDEGIDPIDVRGVLSELFEKDPIVGMPIDSISNDLRAWAETLRVDVKLWTIRKYVDFNDSSNIVYEIPEEYRPDFDTTEENEVRRTGIAHYDVSIADLIQAGLLTAGQELTMPYKPRQGERRTYTAVVQANGSLQVLGKTFSSPSYAALYGIQDAGSDRRTVNGWISWKDSEERTLAELREEYMHQQESDHAEQADSADEK